MPSVCERCLPDNPYVQMLKEDYGETCKLCTRPYTVFRWKADRTARQKRTGICLTCARLKNCCQCCMLDLSFGLPITIRDAALKMVAPGPQSEVNREYFAQNHEREIEEGRGLEGYEKTDEKARELLRRLASSEPYYKKQRRLEAEGASEGGQRLLEGGERSKDPAAQDGRERSAYGSSSGASRQDTATTTRRGNKVANATRKATAPKAADILPPADPNITSLFLTGVEDDLPEHELRTHFAQYGALRSVVCSHRSHCAFLNYIDRSSAEAAALASQGRAVIKGVPLRVQWGKPKPLDNMDRDARMGNARAGREVETAVAGTKRKAIAAAEPEEDLDDLTAAPAPGEGEATYAALAGE